MRKGRAFAAMIVVLFAAVALIAQAEKTQAEKTPYADAYDKAHELLLRHEYFEALKGFQKANQLAGGRSADCYVGMAQTMVGMKTWANVLETTQTAIELAKDNPLLLARAHAARGAAYQAMAEKDPAKLRDAEQELRQALVADPDSRVPDLHFNLGVVLMKQMRDEDGIAELRRELAQRANGSTADEAKALIANPRRAREHYAPDFELTGADGKIINLASLHGRVVLLDFRASQIGTRSLSPVKKLVKDHAGAAFVVVSVFEDGNPDLWRPFAQKNAIDWPFAWDERQRVLRDLEVQNVPAFVLLDAEGIERLRVSGSAYPDTKAVTETIDAQLKAAVKTPAP